MNIVDTEIVKDEGSLQKEIAPVVSDSRSLVVSDAASYEIAGETVKRLTAIEKKIKAFWAPEKEMASKLHKSIVAKEKDMLSVVVDEKSAKIASMHAWAEEQEQARREAAELAATERAAAAAESASSGTAVCVVSAAPTTPAVPTGYGQFVRKTWSAEVTDLSALVKAVAAGLVPVQAIKADEVFLNSQARLHKSSLEFPGVVAVEK